MASALMDLMPKWGKTVIKHAHYKHNAFYKRKTNESLVFSRGKGLSMGISDRVELENFGKQLQM